MLITPINTVNVTIYGSGDRVGFPFDTQMVSRVGSLRRRTFLSVLQQKLGDGR